MIGRAFTFSAFVLAAMWGWRREQRRREWRRFWREVNAEAKPGLRQ